MIKDLGKTVVSWRCNTERAGIFGKKCNSCSVTHTTNLPLVGYNVPKLAFVDLTKHSEIQLLQSKAWLRIASYIAYKIT